MTITIPGNLQQGQEVLVDINDWDNLDTTRKSSLLRENRLFLLRFEPKEIRKNEKVTHVVLCKYKNETVVK